MPADRPCTLLIEDDSRIATLYGKYLHRAGFDFQHADTLNKGLRMLASNGYVAVITDMRLDGAFGTIILERLSEIDHRVAVIVITGYYQEDEALAATKEYGVSFYLSKTTDMTARTGETTEDVVERLRRVLVIAIAQQEWIAKQINKVKAEATIAITDAQRGTSIATARADQLAKENDEWRKAKPPSRISPRVALAWIAVLATALTLISNIIIEWIKKP